eukprot:COSAG05_NODE_775_length_7435_cov_3.124864_8_plen_348_part_00
MSYAHRVMGYVDDAQWHDQAIHRGGRGYVGSSTEVRDIEGSQPRQRYVRRRVPARDLPSPPTEHVGNREIQRARRRHAYERGPTNPTSFAQPFDPKSKPKRMVKELSRGEYYNQPIDGTQADPHYHGHDGTRFQGHARRAHLDPQEPNFERLGAGMAQEPFAQQQELNAVLIREAQLNAPYAPDATSAFRPPVVHNHKPEPDRQMDVTDIEGTKPQIQPAYNYQQRDLMRNDDVEGATAWNWKPLHRRFIGGSHAPRAINADVHAPKLGPAVSLPSTDPMGRGSPVNSVVRFGRRAHSDALNKTAGFSHGPPQSNRERAVSEISQVFQAPQPLPQARDRGQISQVFG